jgi:hypothetical protein
MKLVLVLATFAVLSVAESAQLADVSGTWELEMTWPEAKSTGTCIFQQDGESLTGSCGETDRFPVKGRVEGTQLSWELEVKQNGATGRMQFSGELNQEGTTISGSCSVVGANSGTFTMKKSR